MKVACEGCIHWIPMKEHYGECVLYGLKHCVWTPSDATCDEAKAKMKGGDDE